MWRHHRTSVPFAKRLGGAATSHFSKLMPIGKRLEILAKVP